MLSHPPSLSRKLYISWNSELYYLWYYIVYFIFDIFDIWHTTYLTYLIFYNWKIIYYIQIIVKFNLPSLIDTLFLTSLRFLLGYVIFGSICSTLSIYIYYNDNYWSWGKICYDWILAFFVVCAPSFLTKYYLTYASLDGNIF